MDLVVIYALPSLPAPQLNPRSEMTPGQIIS